MESVLATTRDFQVCGTCYELRGPFTWWIKGTRFDHVQECACNKARHPDGAPTELWYGFDFNTVAELCQACGCQVLGSGSRYSVWFCSHCKQRARALNASVGQALIPIGRHSIMHGISMRARPTDEEIEPFVSRFGALRERIGALSSWAHQVVARNLRAGGQEISGGIALAEYLEGATILDRAARFDAMVSSITRRA